MYNDQQMEVMNALYQSFGTKRTSEFKIENKLI